MQFYFHAQAMYFLWLFIINIILLANNTLNVKCVDLNLEDAENDIKNVKREIIQFLDQASYTFNGLTKVASVPVIFPLDICIIIVEGVKYATALHKHRNGLRHFAVYKYQADGKYVEVIDLPTPAAIALDCKTHAGRGYAALTYNLTEPVQNAKEGSPIFEISATRVRPIQYFASVHLRAMYLRVTGYDLTLLQAYESNKAAANWKCPFFGWSGRSFQRWGSLPCKNARRLEPFSIDYENYVAVANYADKYGRTTVKSEIYKFNKTQRTFQLIQRIRTNGAVDVKYFSVPQNEVQRKHFLIFGNSVGHKPNSEADSVFYVYDNGQFVPYQSLAFYSVERFLPVQNLVAEKFLLFVACNKQDIKIYNLNDWKFEESQVQFTEGALSRGVRRMRTYEENEQTYLVIANELMTENEINIFLPIYKQEEHANDLRQKIIDWTEKEIERLLSIDVDKLNADVEKKLKEQRKWEKLSDSVKSLSNVRINTVKTKSFVSAHLNLNTNYWKALCYAKRALDVLEREMAQKRLTRSLLDDMAEEHVFNEVSVKNLLVRDKINVKRINGVDSKTPVFHEVIVKKIYVSGNYTGPIKENVTAPLKTAISEDGNKNGSILTVDKLIITGKLNNYTWEDLVNNTLKRKGVQFIKAPVIIGELKAESVMVNSYKVNDRNLRQLISTTGGDYVVQQDVQFVDPLQVNDLRINERLNNIHVHNNRFDVLYRYSNITQVVEGHKRFNKLRVLEPITIAGQMIGEQLLSMSPIKAVHQELNLTGNFNINGDVRIGKKLRVTDIIDQQTKLSLNEVLSNCIRMDQPIENVNLKFLSPMIANNTELSFVNKRDMQNLIKTNYKGVQIIEGFKYFPKGLEVSHGFVEAEILNGINITELPERLLLNGTDQTIRVPVHLGKVHVQHINASQVRLNEKNLTDYLTKSGDQYINGTLHATKLHVQTFNVQNLYTDGPIFGHPVADIYNQKTRSAPNPDKLFRQDQKFEGNIYVKNLWLNGTINEVPIEDVLLSLQRLASGKIEYVGDFTFKQEMNLKHLNFTGNFNGIPAKDFGNCFLLRNGEQTFTAPQTFTYVEFKKNLILNGTLNNHKMEKYLYGTYRLDTNEHLGAVVFENTIDIEGQLHTGTLNELRMPEDILLRDAKQPQILQAPLYVHGNVYVEGEIRNAKTLNEFDLAALERYLSYSRYDDTLYMEQAEFEEMPKYKTLNQHDLKHTLDNVWLANENVELIAEYVEMESADFTGLLNIEGTINNRDWEYVKQNYISLTREQQIFTALEFTNDVTFKAIPTVLQHLQLNDGALVESTSNISFNFQEFVHNTLKTGGPHRITGQWTINEAIIVGNLQNVLINNLDLSRDVLLSPAQNEAVIKQEIFAEKRFPSITIKKLYAADGSLVAGVPIAKWINESVYIYENHTINGNLTLQSVNLYNNLRVDGLVNGKKFTKDNLLLRDIEQTISGDVLVRTTFPENERIYTLNIEDLDVKRINGLPVHDFLENQAQNRPNLYLNSTLIFTQPLLVENYHVGKEKVSHNGQDVRWKRLSVNVTQSNRTLYRIPDDWSQLEGKLQTIEKLLFTPYYVLDDFELCTHLDISASAISPLTLPLGDSEVLDIIAVLRPQTQQLDYYVWQEQQKQFVNNSSLDWLPREKGLLDIFKLLIENNRTKQFSNLTGETPGLQAALLQKATLYAEIATLKLPDQNCFAIYGGQSNDVYVYCIKFDNLTIYLHKKLVRHGVKQLLQIELQNIALLYENTIEIWNINGEFEHKQTISVARAKHMASARRRDQLYLAVIQAAKPRTLIPRTINIYSTTIGKNVFRKQQIIECSSTASQVWLTHLPETDDLLLQVHNAGSDQSWFVYQYKGIIGFGNILYNTTLPTAHALQVFKLQTAGKYLTALMADDGIHFVEAKLILL